MQNTIHELKTLMENVGMQPRSVLTARLTDREENNELDQLMQAVELFANDISMRIEWRSVRKHIAPQSPETVRADLARIQIALWRAAHLHGCADTLEETVRSLLAFPTSTKQP